MKSRLSHAFVSAALLCLSALGCAKEESQRPVVAVRVEHYKPLRAMRMTWTVSQPVKAIVFSRPGAFRTGKWAPVIGGQKLVASPQREYIVSDRLTKDFSLTVPVEAVTSVSDYPFIKQFSDGAMVVYTGFLHAVPMTCALDCTAVEAEAQSAVPTETSVHVVPDPSEMLLAQGNESRKPMSFPDTAAGQFIYLGGRPALQRAGVKMVVDPGLPAWIQLEVESKLPVFLDHITRRLGVKLPFQPVVYIPYKRELDRSAGSYTGAVASSNMLLSLTGSRWTRKSDREREELLKLLAHETFHFWNASLFHSIDRPGGRWLHEGSADAIAYVTLYELGLVSPTRFVELQNEAVNRCVVGLADTDLTRSGEKLRSRNFYDCGAVVELALTTALQPTQQNLWKFWAALFSRAKGPFYTHEQFYELSSELTQSPQLIAKLKNLTEGRVHGSATSSQQIESYFLDTLQAAGTGAILSDQNWPQWYHRTMSEQAMEALVEADCGASGSLEALTEDGASVNGASGCRSLKTPEVFRKAGEYAIWEQGVQVYDYIYNNCLSRSEVPLRATDRGPRTDAMCPKLPVRPKFIMLNATAERISAK